MRVLIFLLLKILEISGIIFIPYLIGCLMSKIPHWLCDAEEKGEKYLLGILTIITIFIVLVIIPTLLFSMFKINWDIAGQLIK